MVRKLMVVCALSALAGLAAFPPSAAATERPASGAVQWDNQASADLAVALHHLHDIWNKGDIRSLKKAIIGDAALVTFELDAKTHKPIRLKSKADLDGFVESVASDLEDDGSVQELEHPVVNCRATPTMGICTEECVVHTRKPDGVRTVHRLWSTAIAVKQDGDWKWIQWHMSKASPTEVYKEGQPVASVN